MANILVRNSFGLKGLKKASHLNRLVDLFYVRSPLTH